MLTSSTLEQIGLKLYDQLPQKTRYIVLNSGLKLLRIIEQYAIYSGKEYPTAINIETISACNRTCWYCPRPKESYRMSTETFQRIIDELAAWGYRGRVSPHSYNEPLLDTRIFSFLSCIKEKLPTSNINFYTNGDYLTENIIQRLQDINIALIIVSLHEPSSHKHVAHMMYLKNAYSSFIKLCDLREGKRTVHLTNRGGQVDIGETIKVKKCESIYNMVIRADGNVVLCSRDAQKINILGNIHRQSIPEIWTEKTYSRLRREVSQGILTLPMCQQCGYKQLN